jgi:hypothetical protein
MQFVQEQGFEHLMLEATLRVNQRLETRTPPASSPDKIDEILHGAYQNDRVAAKELTLEVGKTPTMVL